MYQLLRALPYLELNDIELYDMQTESRYYHNMIIIITLPFLYQTPFLNIQKSQAFYDI